MELHHSNNKVCQMVLLSLYCILGVQTDSYIGGGGRGQHALPHTDPSNAFREAVTAFGLVVCVWSANGMTTHPVRVPDCMHL